MARAGTPSDHGHFIPSIPVMPEPPRQKTGTRKLPPSSALNRGAPWLAPKLVVHTRGLGLQPPSMAATVAAAQSEELAGASASDSTMDGCRRGANREC